MMLASLPVPLLGRPVLYRATDEDAPVLIKARIRDRVATVAASIEPVEGGILQCGSLVYEIRHVGCSRRPGFLELQLRRIGASEPEGDE